MLLAPAPESFVRQIRSGRFPMASSRQFVNEDPGEKQFFEIGVGGETTPRSEGMTLKSSLGLREGPNRSARGEPFFPIIFRF